MVMTVLAENTYTSRMAAKLDSVNGMEAEKIMARASKVPMAASKAKSAQSIMRKTVGKAVWGGRMNTKERKQEKLIEASVAMRPLARRGVEGPCFACGESLHSHLGKRGVWVGCPAHGVPPKAMFALVPIVLSAGMRVLKGGTTQRAEAADSKRVWNGVDRRAAVKRGPGRPKGSTNRLPVTAQLANLKLGPRYVYAAADKRKALPETFSGAMQDAYSGLKAAKQPVNASEAAKLAKRPTEANRRCLNVLTLTGYVTRIDTNAPASA